MKTVYNGAGVDNTANAKLWLLQNRVMFVQDLYQIGPAVPLAATVNLQAWQAAPWLYQWTDADYPIKSTYLNATFYPQRLTRGSLRYEMGTKSSDFQFKLYTQDTQQPYQLGVAATSPRGYPPYEDPAMTYKNAYDGKGNWGLAETLKKAIVDGDLQGLPFSLYRAFMPTEGDADTIGIAQMFAGYISKVEVARSYIQISVASLMQAFQRKVPTQLIEPGDRGYSYTPKLQYDAVAQVWGNNQTSIYWTFPTPSYSGNGSDFNDGWMVYAYDADQFDVAPWLTTKWNPYYVRRIRQTVPYQIGWLSYLYEPLPLPPWKLSVESDSVFLYKKTGLANGSSPYGPGFPYVPPAEAAV